LVTSATARTVRSACATSINIGAVVLS